MALGTILRFDETRGYGFIAPAAGGEDVFFHANDFGEHRHSIQSGLRVRYEVAEGERGLKVAAVSILEQQPPPLRRVAAAPSAQSAPSADADQLGEDDGLCDVLSAKDFGDEVTELLIEHVPTLTGAQIGQVRRHLLVIARTHGWVDA